MARAQRLEGTKMKKLSSRIMIAIATIAIAMLTMLVSTNEYRCPKAEILEILDNGIAPSLCALRDQSRQNYSNLVFTYRNSLHKLDSLEQALVELQEAYNSQEIKEQIDEIEILLNKIDITVNGFSSGRKTDLSLLCKELEEMRDKLINLLIQLNPSNI